MDPFTLLALATAAGFLFKKGSSQAKENNETNRQELTYSKDIVARATHAKQSSDYDLETIEVLPEYKLVKMLINQQFPQVFVTGGGWYREEYFRKVVSQ